MDSSLGKGARILATARAVAASFSVAAATLSLGLLAGCVDAPANSVASSARGRAVMAERAERDRLDRELAVLRQTDGQTEAEIRSAKAASVQAAATLRAVQAELGLRLAALQRAEQALQAAQQRGRQTELELAPLRALQAELQQQEQLREAAAARLALGAAAIDGAAAQVAQIEAELLARLTALQQKLAASKQFTDALGGIEKALAEAIQALAPPAAPPVPVAPAAPAATPAQTGK